MPINTLLGLCLFLSFTGNLSGTPAQAPEAGQETLQAARRIIGGSAGRLAGTVRQELTVFDGDNTLLGSIHTVLQLQDGNKDPLWRKASQERQGSPGMVITMDLGIQGNPQALLDVYETWQFLRQERIHDTDSEVWEGVSQKEPGNSVVAWFAKPEGTPLLMQFNLPFRSLLGTRLITVGVTFERDTDGTPLPSRAIMDQSGRHFLVKRRIRMVTEYSNWRIPSDQRRDCGASTIGISDGKADALPSPSLWKPDHRAPGTKKHKKNE